jgi:hypothetical protein
VSRCVKRLHWKTLAVHRKRKDFLKGKILSLHVDIIIEVFSKMELFSKFLLERYFVI